MILANKKYKLIEIKKIRNIKKHKTRLKMRKFYEIE